LESRDLSSDECDIFFSTKNELNNVYRDEVIYCQQHAQLQWFHQNNANTMFFHSIASSHKRANLISSLTIDGVESRDPEVIKLMFYTFINNYWVLRDLLGFLFLILFGLSMNGFLLLKMILLLLLLWRRKFVQPFFSMNPNKSPGPYGFSILFYQKF
jgi:hypothetical protein